jgi:hypothetical protein
VAQTIAMNGERSAALAKPFGGTAMTVQTVTLRVPEVTYQRARRAAETLRRSVEEVLVDAITVTLPLLDDVPAQITDDLVRMAFLNDAALWQIARSTLPPKHHRQMDELLARKGQGRLMAAKQQTLDRLLVEYQALILRRGQAAILLQQRGYDMSNPTVLNRLS